VQAPLTPTIAPRLRWPVLLLASLSDVVEEVRLRYRQT